MRPGGTPVRLLYAAAAAHGGRQAAQRSRGPPRGRRFTLVEVIAALILVAVLGALLIPFFGMVSRRSADAALRLPATARLMTLMENINAAYEQDYHDHLADLQQELATHSAAFGIDGISFTVVTNEFVTFSADGEEQNGGTDTDTLRVTLRAPSGERLTALFPYQVEP